MGELDDALRDAHRQADHNIAEEAWQTDFGGIGEPTADAECPHYDILADTISRMPASAYTHGHVIVSVNNQLVFLVNPSSYGAEMPDDWTGRRRHRAVMRRRKKAGIGARWFLIVSPPAPQPYLSGEDVNVKVLVLDNGSIKTLDHLSHWGGRAEFTRACAYALERAISTGKQLTRQFGGVTPY
jgi:hypothetical protein